MKTPLIAHEEDLVNRVALAAWLASFSDLAGIVSIVERPARRARRVRREIERVRYPRLAGWGGVCFVPTNSIGSDGLVTTADICTLAAQGHVIGSHSCSHPLRMAAPSGPRRMHEWRDSSAPAVAAIAAGELPPRLQQLASRNLKKLLKRAGGDHWLRFRKSSLRLRTPRGCA